jgi:hypothetical protein
VKVFNQWLRLRKRNLKFSIATSAHIDLGRDAVQSCNAAMSAATTVV